MEEKRIDPWGSELIEDYGHLIEEFGLERFPESYKKVLKHRFFEREIVIAHRDFKKVMERIEKKKPFINMTGIATSGGFHLGHKVDVDMFLFFKSLGAKNYFAICDIDAYTSRPKIKSMEEARKYAVENLAHAMALGLEEKDVYVQSKQEQRYYEFVFEISKKITENEFRAVYGHVDLGKVSANLLQYADILHGQLPEYEGKMPSITGIGLDQDPHARLTRDVAQRLPYDLELPSFIYFQHQAGLQKGKKMSSSEPETAIFLSDSTEDVKKKIAGSFTGGRDTVEEQKKKGGQPEVCKIYEIYKFHHPDSKFLKDVYERCKKGELLCGEDKKTCAEFLIKFLEEHQKKYKENLPKAKKIVYGK